MQRDYGTVLEQRQQQQRQQPNLPTPGQHVPTSRPGFENISQLQTKFANALGVTIECAKDAGIDEGAAHELVTRAYRGEW